MALRPEGDVEHLQRVAYQEHHAAYGWNTADGENSVAILRQVAGHVEKALSISGLTDLVEDALRAQLTRGAMDTAEWVLQKRNPVLGYVNGVVDLVDKSVLTGEEPDYSARINRTWTNIRRYKGLLTSLIKPAGSEVKGVERPNSPLEGPAGLAMGE